MNQIIKRPNLENKKVPKKQFIVEFCDTISEIPYEEHSNIATSSTLKQYLHTNKYRLQFLISALVAILFLILFSYHIHKINRQEKLSKELLNNYTLTALYQERNLNTNMTQKQTTFIENPFVIGMIKIPKIGLNYPILSESNSDLLKISLCRFAGPMPNEIGNLCIAGHNYVDHKFFSRLTELEKADFIEIYDLTGRKIDYEIFNKYEVRPNDLSCTSQEVENQKIVTLLTCNNVNGKRTIVKAREK